MADVPMTPAASLGQSLMVARRHGVDFADAWEPAVARALADAEPDEIAGWMEAFEATRGAWAAAWERRAPTRAERALQAVAFDDERVAMADRECPRCGAAIPPSRGGAPRKWCSEKCRRLANYERERVAVAA